MASHGPSSRPRSRPKPQTRASSRSKPSTWARRSRTPPPNARLMVAPASATWGVDVDGERAFPGWPATWRSSGGASLPRSSRATGLAGPTSQSERERVGMGGNGLPYTGVSPRGGTGCRARLHQTRRAKWTRGGPRVDRAAPRSPSSPALRPFAARHGMSAGFPMPNLSRGRGSRAASSGRPRSRARFLQALAGSLGSLAATPDLPLCSALSRARLYVGRDVEPSLRDFGLAHRTVHWDTSLPR